MRMAVKGKAVTWLKFFLEFMWIGVIITTLLGAERISPLLILEAGLSIICYTLTVFKPEFLKKSILAAIAYLMFFLMINFYHGNPDYFNYVAFTMPLLYACIGNNLVLPVCVGMLNMHLFSCYDLPTKVLIDNVVKLAFTTLYQILLVRLVIKVQNDKRTVEEMAIRDDLTGLLNRRGFVKKSQALFAIAREVNCPLAVIFIDINRFKAINDSLGHSVGDALLRHVADLLKDVYGQNSTICRMGGDEFVIYKENVSKMMVRDDLIRLTNRLAESFSMAGQDVPLDASIGVSLYPDDGDDLEALLRSADIAMYYAKEQHRNFLFFSHGMAMDRKILEQDLLKALRQNEFYLVYQPQIDVNTNQLMGCEALIRWKSEKHGLVLPGDFIPLAEESKLIVPIGQWVLEEACRQNKRWQDEGYPPLCVSVNVSVCQMLRPNFVGMVAEILNETGLKPEYLVLELVENMFAYPKEVTPVLLKLKKMGIKIALDDFGSGYSSFSYIKEYPLDYLKIDRHFINGIECNRKDEAIVSTIVGMARFLDTTVIAEGVEKVEQLEFLRQIHCDYVQGFYFGKPCLSSDFEASFLSKVAEADESMRQVSATCESPEI